MERPTRGFPRYGSSGLLVGGKHASPWGLAQDLPRNRHSPGIDMLRSNRLRSGQVH